VRRSVKLLSLVLFLAVLFLVAAFQIAAYREVEAYAIVQADHSSVTIEVFGAENGCTISVVSRDAGGNETEACRFSSDDEPRPGGLPSLFIRLASLFHSRHSENKYVANVSAADCLLSNEEGAKLVLKLGEPVLIFSVIRNSPQGQQGDRLFLLREH
jgi:hypothetical protein